MREISRRVENYSKLYLHCELVVNDNGIVDKNIKLLCFRTQRVYLFFFIIAIQISNEISFPNNVLNFQMEHSVSRC